MRLFIALPIPDRLKECLQVLQRDLQGAGAAVKWVRPEGIHLTLRFLGEVAEDRVEEIQSALREIEGESFAMTVRGVGFFPNARRPRVVWSAIEEESGCLLRLQEDVESCAERLGFEAERNKSFHPHLTLGRLKDPRRSGRLAEIAEEHRSEEIGRFDAVELRLYRSELHSSGAHHSVLGRFPLDGGGSAE